MNRQPAPFPLVTSFQNGPRRQECAPENLFKPTKDFPPPRPNCALLTAADRSEDPSTRREREQRRNCSLLAALCGLPLVGPELLNKFGVDKTS